MYEPDRWVTELTGWMGDRFEPSAGSLPMPWKETCHMDERIQFIAGVLAGEDEMTGLCREFGITRKTATSGSGGIVVRQ